MLRPILLIFVFLSMMLGGCVTEQPKTPLVPSNPFGTTPPSPATQAASLPASIQAAARADTIGRKLITANPQLGIQPLIRTIGAPQPEIFHKGTNEVDVTEGLVNQCATDGQLAAVLAVELGKMIADREALAGSLVRGADHEPPMDVPVGSDSGGRYGPADQLHRAELAKYDQERRQRAVKADTPLDPEMLARGYLTKAGYAIADLDAAASVLRSAADHNALAKQILNAPQPQR
jgi:hypothetical protein